jgi:hypothetical protein
MTAGKGLGWREHGDGLGGTAALSVFGNGNRATSDAAMPSDGLDGPDSARLKSLLLSQLGASAKIGHLPE